MRKVFKLIGVLIVIPVLFCIASILAFYHLVRVGEVREFLRSEIQKRSELHTRLGEATLEIGWVTGIVFHDLALSEPGAAEPAITAAQIHARVALLPLLRREIVFYEIRVQRPKAQFVRDRSGRYPLIDKLLNLPFIKQQDSEFSLDLRSLKIDGGDISLSGQVLDEKWGEWRLVEADLDLERMRGERLRAFLKDLLKRSPVKPEAAALVFNLKGAVLKDQSKMSVKARGRLAFPAETLEFNEARWDGDLDLVNVPIAVVKDALRLPVKSMTGYLAQRLHIEGNPGTSLRLSGDLAFKQLAVDAPELFLAPITGGDGRASFEVDWSRQRLQIARADFRADDIKFSLQGDVAAMDSDDPHFRLNLTGLFAPVSAFPRYLPLKIVRSLRLEETLKAIHSGHVDIKKAGIDATLSQLRRPSEAIKQLTIEAELREFSGKPPTDAALPFRGGYGKFRATNGVLAFENLRGSYGDSRFDAVNGSYDFAGAAPGRADITVRGEVNLAELKDQTKFLDLSAKSAKMMSSIQELNGRGKIQLALKRSPEAPVEFEGSAALDHARIRYSEFLISEIHGELAFTPKAIKGEQIQALLSGSPIQISLALNDYDSDEGTFDLNIASTGVRANILSSLLLDSASPRDSGVVRGAVRYTGSLADSKRRNFTGDLDLLNVQLLVRPLLQPLRELYGKIRVDETGIDFANLTALIVGVPASANGRWRYAGKPRLLFDFAAPNLDITYLISQIDPESSEFYATLVAEGKISLDKGRIKNFEFADLRTDASIDHRVWRLTNLTARSAGGMIQGITTIYDRPETLGVATEPKVQGVPVQSFLKWFDITNTEMTGKVTLGGKLETIGKNDVERKRNLNGVFKMRIDDGTINRMRILVQILNLLDLSRWFTLQLPDLTKEGIRFRSISADFKVVQGVYSTENLVVDSSDLRMTGAGKIDEPKDELDFVLAVRPFAGLDTALSYIPLLGRGVAAIKNSFLVASFNIQGPIDNPTITPAPLSTVAEWFWGVLGIPKNLIGFGDGEKKEEPAQPPKDRAK